MLSTDTAQQKIVPMQYPHPTPNWPFPTWKDYPYKAPPQPKRDPTDGIPVAPF